MYSNVYSVDIQCIIQYMLLPRTDTAKFIEMICVNENGHGERFQSKASQANVNSMVWFRTTCLKTI